MTTLALCLDSGGAALPYDAPDVEKIADVPRCECCGKPLDRDDDDIRVDARDFANWVASLWWQDKRTAGLIFARLMLPRAPLGELAGMAGCSKATATRLWQRVQATSPQLAEFIRGTERRGGNRYAEQNEKETAT